MLRSFHHTEFPARRIAARREESVTVVVPARECAATIGPIAQVLTGLVDAGAVDRALVIDADSADGTAAIARAAGLEVISESALMPEFGRVLGKGDAMWRALSVVRSDVACFVDGDSGHFGEHFVCGTLGPLLLEPGVEFVKGHFRRPFRTGAGTLASGGGRVTELTARPLLRRFWPELAAFAQPLAGEMAARRRLLASIPFATGYAVETAMLIDVYRAVGANSLAQVDLDVRQNDHQPLAELAAMADEVLAAATARLVAEGRLQAPALPDLTERPPMAAVRAAAA